MSTTSHTIASLLMHVTSQLQTGGFDQTSATQEARWLLAHVLGQSIEYLFTHAQEVLNAKHVDALHTLLEQRITEHKPLGYILGSVPFCNLNISVKPPVLIPRMETEEWVTWLIEQHHTTRARKLRILDLCTGSGCIALSLAHHLPHAQVTGADITNEVMSYDPNDFGIYDMVHSTVSCVPNYFTF